MTTEADAQNPFIEVMSYMRHQASKGLPALGELMERTGKEWVTCLDGMSEEQANFGQEGEWSSKAVLGHILSVSRRINRQIEEIAAGKNPGEPFTDPALTMAEQREYREMRIAELRANAVAMMQEAKAVADSLEEGAAYLETRFRHPMFGDMNVPEWLAFQRVHSLDHMQQIEKNKADPAYPRD